MFYAVKNLNDGKPVFVIFVCKREAIMGFVKG
jgi:hypothetical protein